MKSGNIDINNPQNRAELERREGALKAAGVIVTGPALLAAASTPAGQVALQTLLWNQASATGAVAGAGTRPQSMDRTQTDHHQDWRSMMATPFKLDHDELARCALELRKAMLEFREKVIGYYEQEIIDQELDHLAPILDLCIAKEMEEPFPLQSYVNPRIFGDVLSVPVRTKPYYALVDALYGGMTTEEFWRTEYYKERRLPRQMRENPRLSAK